MEINEYLSDPCRASSLPYWKTEYVTVPDGMAIVRDDAFSAGCCSGTDEPYFKMIHHLSVTPSASLPDGFTVTGCSMEDFANHINRCYRKEHVGTAELFAYTQRIVYRPELWIAVSDCANGAIAATGIAELDSRIGEGILEWIQVSPEYRRRGLGSFVVCELLRKMKGSARFATVSGRMNSESRPLLFYQACGFTDPVVWHILSE